MAVHQLFLFKRDEYGVINECFNECFKILFPHVASQIVLLLETSLLLLFSSLSHCYFDSLQIIYCVVQHVSSIIRKWTRLSRNKNLLSITPPYFKCTLAYDRSSLQGLKWRWRENRKSYWFVDGGFCWGVLKVTGLLYARLASSICSLSLYGWGFYWFWRGQKMSLK